MNDLICDLCGKNHAVQNCKLFVPQEKVSELDVEPQILLPFQTLPTWVYMDDNPKKLIACREIETSFKIGPFLAPQSSSLNHNIEFPLYVQISNACRLWIDQSDISKCNWLSLIVASPFNNNLVACQIGESIYFVVSKPIKVGQELKVWYAPFYKTKLPSEILEQIVLLRENREKETVEPRNYSSSTHIIVRNESGDDGDALTNSTSMLNGNQILIEGSFLPDNIVTLESEPSMTRGSGVGSLSNSKVLSSCSVSLSSSLATILSSTNAPSNSDGQSVFLVSTSFPSPSPINSLNLEPSLYNYLSLNSKPSELTPVSIPNSPFRLCQRGTESDYVSEVRLKDNSISTLTSENVIFEVQKEFSDQDNSNETSDSFPNHVDKCSCSNTVKNEEPQFNLEKHLNRPSLQNISISKTKITFTHRFLEKDPDNALTKCQKDSKNATYGPKTNEKQKDPHIIFSIKTGQVRKNMKGKTLKEPVNNMSNIQLSEKGEVEGIDDSNYDMVSLCVSKSSSQTPLTKIIKKQKKVESDLKTKETVRKRRKMSSSSGHHWTCSQCSETFMETLPFALHLKNHILIHLGKPIACQVCSFRCKDTKQFETHINSHGESPSPSHILNADQKDCSNEAAASQNTTSDLSILKDAKQVREVKTRNWQGNFNCPICPKRFNTGKYLLRHLSRHSGEFVCSLCKKEFTRNESLRKHVCVDSRRLQCALCSKTFASLLSYDLHSHHNENVRCAWCLKIFVSEASLHKHQTECARNPERDKDPKEKVVDGCSRFCCHICNRNFSTLFFLKNHASFCKQLAIVSEKGSVNCAECDCFCASPAQLRLHLQTHTHPYLCLGCLHRFRSRGTYELHICGVEFSCDLCGCVLRSLQELYKHITIHGPSPWCCSRCRYPFYKNESLKKHRCLVEVRAGAEASERRKVRCPFCPALFAAEHNRKKHMASLHDVPMKQNFSCGDCGKAFHRSDLLKTHEQTHAAPSFECRQCRKRFKSQRSFANHAVSHNRDFRFACTHCHKGFAQKKDCLRHQKTHEMFLSASAPPANFKCQPCNIHFSCTEHLESHLSSHRTAAPPQSNMTSKPHIKL